ncbi:MAG: hypothetical protein ACI87E_003294 [Mariniblastus sp.]|jgi:hypothetical protein
MISFLRPFTLVILMAIAFAVGIQNCPPEIQEVAYAPAGMFSSSTDSDSGGYNFAVYCLAIGFAGWLVLESLWAFLWRKNKSAKRSFPRSFIPRISLGKIACVGLFGFLAYRLWF